MSLSHNPYDTDHPTLTAQEQREAWWRGSSDRFVRPYTEDVSFADNTHLTEGYNSRKVDAETWAKIAFHLAAGVPIIKVAEHYKLSRSTIWRALSRSHNLRRRVAEERSLLRREADSRFVAIRELVVDTLYRAVADGNIRAAIWMADRLDLGGDLLQGTEKPPKPGYARVPQSWFPTPNQTAAILVDLDAPPGPTVPVPTPEEPPAAATGPAMEREQPAIPVEPSPTADPAPDPIPYLAPLDGGPTDDGSDPLPDFPADLRWCSRRRRRCKVRSTRRPILLDPLSRRLRFGGYSIRRRAAPRMLAWILHNCLPLADGVDGTCGRSSARWSPHAAWLTRGDDPFGTMSHSVSQG